MILSLSLHPHVLLPSISCLLIQPFWPASNSLSRPRALPPWLHSCLKASSTVLHLDVVAHPLGSLPWSHRTGLESPFLCPKPKVLSLPFCLSRWSTKTKTLLCTFCVSPADFLTQEKCSIIISEVTYVWALSRIQAESINWRERWLCF